MIVVHTLPPQTSLIPVATGKATNGQPYTVEVAPDYLAYQDRLRGAELYRRCQPIELCENTDQHTGWLDEEEWHIGQAQFVRALELEDCPSEWAVPYAGGKPSDIVTGW